MALWAALFDSSMTSPSSQPETSSDGADTSDMGAREELPTSMAVLEVMSGCYSDHLKGGRRCVR